MKKVLALALVLCMAVACFAIAPASAENYWDNLLIFTEDNIGTVYDAPPWGYNGEGYFCSWSYPSYCSPAGWADNTASKLWSLQQTTLIPGENRFGNAYGLVADLSKSTALTAADSGNAGGWGNFLDIYTKQVEAGKTYTFFFKVKASAEVDAANLVFKVYPEGNFASNFTSYTEANATLTTEWQTVKFVFTATASNTNTCFRIVTVEKAEMSGYVYIDGLAMVEGTTVDADAFYASFVDPADIDGDKIYNNEDTDVDGDGILNQFDRDIDGDGTKNVWDYDMDNDLIDNWEDATPFGGVVGSPNEWPHLNLMVD